MNIGAFFSGGMDPYWPHVALLGISLAGSVTVTWGLVRESDKFWKLTNLLIVGGVVIESICTILLFGFDEGISNTQQSKIIALENELAPRILAPDAQSRIADKMRLFHGTRFDFSALMDSEPENLLDQIEAALTGAEWTEEDWTRSMAIYRPNGFAVGLSVEVGITVTVSQTKEAQLLPIAKELAKALRDEGLAAEAKFAPASAPINPDIINIAVGRKPTPKMSEFFAPTARPKAD
jgi:hypothetical protein